MVRLWSARIASRSRPFDPVGHNRQAVTTDYEALGISLLLSTLSAFRRGQSQPVGVWILPDRRTFSRTLVRGLLIWSINRQADRLHGALEHPLSCSRPFDLVSHNRQALTADSTECSIIFSFAAFSSGQSQPAGSHSRLYRALEHPLFHGPLIWSVTTSRQLDSARRSKILSFDLVLSVTTGRYLDSAEPSDILRLPRHH